MKKVMPRASGGDARGVRSCALTKRWFGREGAMTTAIVGFFVCVFSIFIWLLLCGGRARVSTQVTTCRVGFGVK
jgi:hypothetical protein